MSVKTAKQVKAEIATLRAIKPKVLHYSGFGDDHHRAIDVQVEVLENGWDSDDINTRYPDHTDNSSAYEAVQWREGDAEEGLADSWKELVRK